MMGSQVSGTTLHKGLVKISSLNVDIRCAIVADKGRTGAIIIGLEI